MKNDLGTVERRKFPRINTDEICDEPVWLRIFSKDPLLETSLLMRDAYLKNFSGLGMCVGLSCLSWNSIPSKIYVELPEWYEPPKRIVLPYFVRWKLDGQIFGLELDMPAMCAGCNFGEIFPWKSAQPEGWINPLDASLQPPQLARLLQENSNQKERTGALENRHNPYFQRS